MPWHPRSTWPRPDGHILSAHMVCPHHIVHQGEVDAEGCYFLSLHDPIQVLGDLLIGSIEERV